MPTSATEKIIFIGLNIGYYRRVRHLTQVELAEAVGISSNYLSQVERGYKSISLVKLLKIAEVLGVDEKNFFDFSKSPNLI
jgi:transcriptional regulator with XRE-family HTH domain